MQGTHGVQHIQDQPPTGVMLTADQWRTVTSCPIFSAVDQAVLASLCDHHRLTSYAPHQLIFAQGDAADGFYIVLDGWVKLFRSTPSGGEVVVAVFTRGESFAEAAFFLGAAYPASAEAASNLRLLKIDSTRFNEAMATIPGLSATLLASMVHHTDRLSAEIASLKLLSTPRRLADFLIRQVPAAASEATVVLPYEKTLLAGRLGMTPESLSRALATLRKLGVEVAREHVHITRVSDLAAFVRPSRRGARG